jgi:hypothetical protein
VVLLERTVKREGFLTMLALIGTGSVIGILIGSRRRHTAIGYPFGMAEGDGT